MRKRTLPAMIVAFLIMCAFTTQAQKSLYIGAQGGLSIPNLTATAKETNPMNEGFSSRVGPHFGLLVEKQFSNLFSVQAEVNYSGQGGKRNGIQAIRIDPFLGYIYADIKNTSRLNYIQVPVMAKINLGLSEKVKFFVNAGGFVGFLVAANQITEGQGNLYLDKNKQSTVPFTGVTDFSRTTNVIDDLNKVNVGVIGAIGFSYDLGPGKIFIQGGGSYGFVKLQKSPVNGVNRTGAGIVTLGYAHRLGKN